MRTLPRNISAHPDGWLVRVVRNRVTYQAFVPQSRADGLERAVALRDRFLRIVGEVRANRHRVKGRSNTGWSGISETTMWRHNHPHPCFSVHWNVPRASRLPGQRGTIAKMRRFYYGPKCTREQAKAQAIRCREQMTGLKLLPT